MKLIEGKKAPCSMAWQLKPEAANPTKLSIYLDMNELSVPEEVAKDRKARCVGQSRHPRLWCSQRYVRSVLVRSGNKASSPSTRWRKSSRTERNVCACA